MAESANVKTRYSRVCSRMQVSTDRDTVIASLIPDASLASLIPIQIGTLHAQVCKLVISGSMVSFLIMQVCNHASSLDSVDVINDSHSLQVRRFRNPVSISLITLQCARAEYELAKTCIMIAFRRSTFIDETRDSAGGGTGFLGSTRYRSKSVEGRPVYNRGSGNRRTDL